jgi:hypothetical protein
MNKLPKTGLGCQMPCPGVLRRTGPPAEICTGITSLVSVSITDPSLVNVARPGIGGFGVGLALGVKVNSHEPTNEGMVVPVWATAG